MLYSGSVCYLFVSLLSLSDDCAREKRKKLMETFGLQKGTFYKTEIKARSERTLHGSHHHFRIFGDQNDERMMN